MGVSWSHTDPPAYAALIGPLLPLSPALTQSQTTCVACYGLAFNAGFGTYVLAMDYQSYLNVGDVEGNRPEVRTWAGELRCAVLC